MKFAYFIIGVSLMLAATAAAKTYSAFGQRILAGECALREDPELQSSRVWPVVCLKLKGASQYSFRQNRSDLNLGINHASIYTGIHISHILSFHFEGLRRRLFFLEVSEGSIARDDTITDSLFVQLGNRTLTRFSMAIGRLDMPFGTDHRPGMEIYDLAFRNLSYWNFPDYVANLTFDNLVDARLEIAYGSSRLSLGQDVEARSERSKESTVKEEKLREALSVRASYDLSALEGSRIALSLYESRNEPRRFGLSIANRGSNDRKSAFEWVRTGTFLRPDKDYGQLFRLTHATGFRAGNRTVFEFELDHKNYRLLGIGYDKKIFETTIMRSSATYYWQDFNNNEEDGFLLSLGLEAKL